ncbi:MAG: hypothetical protein R3C59_03515 [Planctomycetaceae bacterium]
MDTMKRAALGFLLLVHLVGVAGAQDSRTAKQELGSRTAKNGFRNEDDIRDKFNNWTTDKDARKWLTAMQYQLNQIKSVTAVKPHGQKADVEVTIKTKSGTSVEGISIKLVSSETGFNQIDKRWLRHYAQMWKMPPEVVQALKLYVGETAPIQPSRHAERMYLDELPAATQTAVIDFFKTHKDEVISDLFAGDGEHAADWFMVTFKGSDSPRSLIRSLPDTIRFYAEGDVMMTKAGNLKIGRVSMQRKGGDNGRESAKMLQFKINPVALFDADSLP